MSRFEWTTDGRILYAGHANGDDMPFDHDHKDGELLAHYDDDRDLILDGEDNWSLDLEGGDLREALAADALVALREDGLLPEQFRDFTWENYACFAAGLMPWETTVLTTKACQECGKDFDRGEMTATNAWAVERNFQRAQICLQCLEKIADPRM